MTKGKRNIFIRIIRGEWFSLSVFKKYLVEVLLVVTLLVIFITFKFSLQTKMGQIISLRRELVDVRTNMINVSSTYSSLTRESEMTELVDTLKLGLKAPEQPPYNLDKKQE